MSSCPIRTPPNPNMSLAKRTVARLLSQTASFSLIMCCCLTLMSIVQHIC